ncbi:integrase_H2C2 domain-containing protein [Trichonephila clavata]|uniref:Integrase_H2C2 domain-containing protein n=1 Tax=Trichonephila clavata TaxID=2740835 RepID=A0A8X6I0X6_TRICU|nr:integrase_H2C2 domain-containing protein [Trichonephila clavata]
MEIMKAATFELRCWAHTGVQDQESQNILGLKWDTETDELYCVSPETDIGFNENISKRKLLSIVNSLYDPIGFTSLATLLPNYPKIIRMTAWVLRFCHNLKANSHKLRKELTFQEIQMAEEPVIRIIQAEWLSEMQEKYSKTIQFYEENKILKVRSRLILGEDAEDFVRTTVLPDHPIV